MGGGALSIAPPGSFFYVSIDATASAGWFQGMLCLWNRAMASFRLCAHDLEGDSHSNGGVLFKGSPLPYLGGQRLCGLCWNGVGNEMHMVTQYDGCIAVRQHHPHLFNSDGLRSVGGNRFTGQLVSPQQFRHFMHHCFFFKCSQIRWENPPDGLLFADCKMPDEARYVVDDDPAHFFNVYSEKFFDFYSDVCCDCEIPWAMFGSFGGCLGSAPSQVRDCGC